MTWKIKSMLQEFAYWRRMQWPHYKRWLGDPIGFTTGVRQWLGSAAP